MAPDLSLDAACPTRNSHIVLHGVRSSNAERPECYRQAWLPHSSATYRQTALAYAHESNCGHSIQALCPEWAGDISNSVFVAPLYADYALPPKLLKLAAQEWLQNLISALLVNPRHCYRTQLQNTHRGVLASYSALARDRVDNPIHLLILEQTPEYVTVSPASMSRASTTEIRWFRVKEYEKIMFALTRKPWYNDPDAGNSPGGLPFSRFGSLPASVSLRFLRCCRRVRDLRNVGCFTTRNDEKKAIWSQLPDVLGSALHTERSHDENGNQTLCRQPELSDDRPAAP